MNWRRWATFFFLFPFSVFDFLIINWFMTQLLLPHFKNIFSWTWIWWQQHVSKKLWQGLLLCSVIDFSFNNSLEMYGNWGKECFPILVWYKILRDTIKRSYFPFCFIICLVFSVSEKSWLQAGKSRLLYDETLIFKSIYSKQFSIFKMQFT